MKYSQYNLSIWLLCFILSHSLTEKHMLAKDDRLLLVIFFDDSYLNAIKNQRPSLINRPIILLDTSDAIQIVIFTNSYKTKEFIQEDTIMLLELPNRTVLQENERYRR